MPLFVRVIGKKPWWVHSSLPNKYVYSTEGTKAQVYVAPCIGTQHRQATQMTRLEFDCPYVSA